MASRDSKYDQHYIKGYIEIRIFKNRRYPANAKSMIPLPDPDAPLTSPSHPNAYPVFNTGDTVMALYPDTSCFYRAEVTEVVSPPREGRVSRCQTS